MIEIILEGGYTDSRKTLHNHVVFDKRPKGADYFAIDENPASDVPTQFQLMMVAATITKFGALPMPVPLDTLLKLDFSDIQALIKAHNQFMSEGVGERKTEFPSDAEVKLAFGVEDNSVTYTRVRFGKRLVGYDLVAADNAGFTKGMRREYFLIGQEITSISTDDGQYKLDGPLDLKWIEKLDAEDFVSMRIAAVKWRDSFRGKRQAIQSDAPRPNTGDSARDRLESPRDSQSNK